MSFGKLFLVNSGIGYHHHTPCFSLKTVSVHHGVIRMFKEMKLHSRGTAMANQN